MIKVISGREFPTVVIPLIEQATESIDIVVFDWRWYGADPGASVQLFNQAIARAVKRGVKVRAITNAIDVVKTLNNIGVKAKKIITQKLMHAKMMIVDSNKVITGSHNYTMSAFHLNVELSVLIQDEPNSERFGEFYENLWQR